MNNDSGNGNTGGVADSGLTEEWLGDVLTYLKTVSSFHRTGVGRSLMDPRIPEVTFLDPAYGSSVSQPVKGAVPQEPVSPPTLSPSQAAQPAIGTQIHWQQKPKGASQPALCFLLDSHEYETYASGLFSAIVEKGFQMPLPEVAIATFDGGQSWTSQSDASISYFRQLEQMLVQLPVGTSNGSAAVVVLCGEGAQNIVQAGFPGTTPLPDAGRSIAFGSVVLHLLPSASLTEVESDSAEKRKLWQAIQYVRQQVLQ